MLASHHDWLPQHLQEAVTKSVGGRGSDLELLVPPPGASLHVSRRPVYHARVATQRLNITLDGARAAKLARLAARVHVNEGTLARSLLSSAIDDADPDPANVVAVLDGIDGAWERAQLGRRQAEAGETTPIDDL